MITKEYQLEEYQSGKANWKTSKVLEQLQKKCTSEIMQISTMRHSCLISSSYWLNYVNIYG